MQEELSKTRQREMKLENGEVIQITEEEFQNVVDVFKMLAETDRKILLEAVNGMKIKLAPVPPDQIKKHINKQIWVAITVKEELQMKSWGFYYKLEKVTLEGYDAKKKLIKIQPPIWEKSLEIEPRGIFHQIE